MICLERGSHGLFGAIAANIKANGKRVAGGFTQLVNSLDPKFEIAFAYAGILVVVAEIAYVIIGYWPRGQGNSMGNRGAGMSKKAVAKCLYFVYHIAYCVNRQGHEKC